MKSLPRRYMQQLMEVYVGQPQGLPPIDVGSQTDFIEEFLKAGAPEFRLAFMACSLALRPLALIMMGKTFSRLGLEGQQRFINKCINSRNPAIRGVALIPGLGVLVSYYRRPDVALSLGFDAVALKKEADLRNVSRDRDLPEKEAPS